MSFSIPILYYHRIGAPDPIHLSTPVELFERQMRFLAGRGVETLPLSRLPGLLAAGKAPLRPAVVITFDDGFRDNLLHAAPVLKHYGFHATVFQITSLIRPFDQPPVAAARDFTAAHTAARRGDYGDFLSRAELVELAASEMFEIHSHSHAHRQVFSAPVVKNFFPTEERHWGVLSCYEQPLSNDEWPVLERTSGLVTRAWQPDCGAIAAFRQQHGSAWKTRFRELATGKLAAFFHEETPSAWKERVEKDLRLGEELTAAFHEPGKGVLCWPWGAQSPEGTRLARECGYAGAVLTSTGPNAPGTDPFLLKRFPVKKSSLASFAVGYWARAHPGLARLYEKFHGWF
jgi:hypothetical protein